MQSLRHRLLCRRIYRRFGPLTRMIANANALVIARNLASWQQ